MTRNDDIHCDHGCCLDGGWRAGRWCGRVDDVAPLARAGAARPHPVETAVVAELRMLDAVAYIRFASVYEAFESVEQFTEAILPLSREDG